MCRSLISLSCTGRISKTPHNKLKKSFYLFITFYSRKMKEKKFHFKGKNFFWGILQKTGNEGVHFPSEITANKMFIAWNLHIH